MYLMKKNYLIVLVIALGLITCLSSCVKPPDFGQDFGNTGCLGCGTQNTTSIIIYYSRFSPDTLIVKKGAIVTWSNADNYTHNLISTNDTSFRSGNILSSRDFIYTAKNIGTLRYHCSIHSEAATLIVIP